MTQIPNAACLLAIGSRQPLVVSSEPRTKSRPFHLIYRTGDGVYVLYIRDLSLVPSPDPITEPLPCRTNKKGKYDWMHILYILMLFKYLLNHQQSIYNDLLNNSRLYINGLFK